MWTSSIVKCSTSIAGGPGDAGAIQPRLLEERECHERTAVTPAPSPDAIGIHVRQGFQVLDSALQFFDVAAAPVHRKLLATLTSIAGAPTDVHLQVDVTRLRREELLKGAVDAAPFVPDGVRTGAPRIRAPSFPVRGSTHRRRWWPRRPAYRRVLRRLDLRVRDHFRVRVEQLDEFQTLAQGEHQAERRLRSGSAGRWWRSQIASRHLVGPVDGFPVPLRS